MVFQYPKESFSSFRNPPSQLFLPSLHLRLRPLPTDRNPGHDIYRSSNFCCFARQVNNFSFLCIPILHPPAQWKLKISQFSYFRHRKSSNYSYCLIICIPPVIYGIISVILGFHYADKAEISICNPPNSLQTVGKPFLLFSVSKNLFQPIVFGILAPYQLEESLLSITPSYI